MQITKLTLNNFSSYEDTNVFDFGVEDGKPIVLIGGQNGAGKTSLFTAIKIALYGPLAFGYTAFNTFYFKKIKSFINYNAFQNDDLRSGVAIELKVINERDVKKYTIQRKWSIIDTKLSEEYIVLEDGNVLEESEKSFFESYLNSVIPPELFDFFLFDGEEVGNIFSEDNYNKYLKNSILTMCGIDTFSIIQSFCKSYIGKSSKSDDEALSVKYHQLEEEIFIKQADINAKTASISDYQSQIDRQAAIIEQQEREFLRAGGILKEKNARLEIETADLNKKREALSRETKEFFETLMPFYIVRKLIPQIEAQINYEEKQSIYEYVSYMVSQEFLSKALEGKTDDPDDASRCLYDAILEKLRPSRSKTDDIILDLSKDEQSRVEQVITAVEDIDAAEIIKKIKKRKNYTARVVSINQEIRESLSREDGKKYLDAIEKAKENITSLQIAKHKAEEDLEGCETELAVLRHELEMTHKSIIENTQSKHVYELSGSIAAIMGELIATRCAEIREQLASKTLTNLKNIYRKENLISIIEVSDDFKLSLYQSKMFAVVDLKSMIVNLGVSEFYRTIGNESISILLDHFNADNIAQLTAEINGCNDNELSFELYKKVDLTALSKGERQIFILALYWAIVQISCKSIPFIIDTPYARIDANHREEISKKFFPGISDQVIILSTDEEITKDYYDIIRPYIAKEYLLSNDRGENKTTITSGYFFKDD